MPYHPSLQSKLSSLSKISFSEISVSTRSSGYESTVSKNELREIINEQVSELVEDLKISEGKRVEAERKSAKLEKRIDDLEDLVENLKLNFHQIEEQNELLRAELEKKIFSPEKEEILNEQNATQDGKKEAHVQKRAKSELLDDRKSGMEKRWGSLWSLTLDAGFESAGSIEDSKEVKTRHCFKTRTYSKGKVVTL
ncbi:Oidioi.mRNA.OKI2018_I69.PAR.g9970.t1.cds [Oikopleura dioica]|uniref:Oidioi.mRNA.OKI2018_I69.PAR.g9970.t1.cds n=1 Tax=Oikopleura dioica TaxID=34765 RepID=A0ABN7RRT2_OIKDI|nr:Oidioi.mRNA.OKI2018_I69.PAR.g9970.t1.cds [Oikopleura dioica]